MSEVVSMRSRRSYLIQPFYLWIIDSGCTPYLSVNTTFSGVKVPEKFIRNGQIVLNIKPQAVQNFSITKTHISFQATFGGVEQQVEIPLRAVLAIYAKENEEGILFDDRDDAADAAEADKKPHLRLIE